MEPHGRRPKAESSGMWPEERRHPRTRRDIRFTWGSCPRDLYKIRDNHFYIRTQTKYPHREHPDYHTKPDIRARYDGKPALRPGCLHTQGTGVIRAQDV